MGEPIEESYFNWLCAKVISVQNQNYWELMRILYSTEFVWIIPGDGNREADGLELRQHFIAETHLTPPNYWFEVPCSLLEMFISFSRIAAFQTDRDAREWFWIFMDNMQLEEYRRVSKSDRDDIAEILYNFVWRTYESSGRGGMFPMRNPGNDQRKVEVWYQFCEYLDDQGLLDNLL